MWSIINCPKLLFPSLFDGFNKNRNILVNKEQLKPIKGKNSRFLQIFCTLAIRNFNSFNDICCIKILRHIIANITEQYQIFYLWNYNKITGGGDITVVEVQFKKYTCICNVEFCYETFVTHLSWAFPLVSFYETNDIKWTCFRSPNVYFEYICFVVLTAILHFTPLIIYNISLYLIISI